MASLENKRFYESQKRRTGTTFHIPISLFYCNQTFLLSCCLCSNPVSAVRQSVVYWCYFMMKVEGSLCSSIPNQGSSTKSQERCSVTIERRKLPQKVRSPTTMMKTAKPGQNIFSIGCKRFEAPFYRQHPWLSPLYMFFPNPPLLTIFFWQYCPNDIQVKHKNKLMREKYFLWL